MTHFSLEPPNLKSRPIGEQRVVGSLLLLGLFCAEPLCAPITVSTAFINSLNTQTTFQLYLALHSMWGHFQCFRTMLTMSRFSREFSAAIFCRPWKKTFWFSLIKKILALYQGPSKSQGLTLHRKTLNTPCILRAKFNYARDKASHFVA